MGAPPWRGRAAMRRRLRHPAQLVAGAFALGIAIGTALLSLPVARAGEGHATFLEALFTATSAICVTGLTVVDTPVYWSAFGEALILALIQVGGFGIMTLASLLGLLVARRLGLRTRLTAQAETRTVGLGDVRRVLVGVVAVSVIFEALTALVLTIRLATRYDEPIGEAVYHGVFHAVSAFNNAGFSLYSDNLTRFVTDPVVCAAIAVAVIAGGLGFPVLFELRRELRSPSTWTLHTRMVLWMTGLLLAAGTVAIVAFEWTNPDTLGPLGIPAKLMVGAFHAVQPRTAGFNALDYGDMRETSWLVTDALMLIGGAPAGTAGGVKVTTIAVLAYIVLAEARGDETVHIHHRRLPAGAQRQALSIVALAMSVIAVSTVALVAITDETLDRVLFEAISAFSTVGLTTGITADVPDAAKYVLVVLMFLGRVGTVTVASALALRSRPIMYRLPEERPIIG